MLSSLDTQALLLSGRLALLTTILLLTFGTPLAWWLARTKLKVRVLIETLLALPLVLPPTVIGFYLLLFLGKSGPLTPLAHALGLASFAFTFEGLLIGSVIYSAPFVIQPLVQTFRSISQDQLDAAQLMGADGIDRFFSLILPISKHGILSAFALGFAHTLGEFGIILMLGGNIPGETQTASLSIYDHVESLNYDNAHQLSLILLTVAFISLLTVHLANGKTPLDKR